MNQVLLIGRVTKDPDVRTGADGQVSVARFAIAIDRGKDANGADKGADYPTIVCFGKTATVCQKYLTKGRLVGITGKIQTGSYEKDGKKVYTSEVVGERIEFLSANPDGNNQTQQKEEPVEIEVDPGDMPW